MPVKKVLVVDDSSVDRANIQAIVVNAGCEVITASSGQEAMEKAREEKPDLIFLDVIMPKLDGFATCRMLGRDDATRHIPVVFTSSKNQKADRIWAQMQGGKAYIVKPFTPDQITAQIDAFSLDMGESQVDSQGVSNENLSEAICPLLRPYIGPMTDIVCREVLDTMPKSISRSDALTMVDRLAKNLRDTKTMNRFATEAREKISDLFRS